MSETSRILQALALPALSLAAAFASTYIAATPDPAPAVPNAALEARVSELEEALEQRRDELDATAQRVNDLEDRVRDTERRVHEMDRGDTPSGDEARAPRDRPGRARRPLPPRRSPTIEEILEEWRDNPTICWKTTGDGQLKLHIRRERATFGTLIKVVRPGGE